MSEALHTHYQEQILAGSREWHQESARLLFWAKWNSHLAAFALMLVVLSWVPGHPKLVATVLLYQGLAFSLICACFGIVHTRWSRRNNKLFNAMIELMDKDIQLHHSELTAMIERNRRGF